MRQKLSIFRGKQRNLKLKQEFWTKMYTFGRIIDKFGQKMDKSWIRNGRIWGYMGKLGA